jgi:hypothetical protein
MNDQKMVEFQSARAESLFRSFSGNGGLIRHFSEGISHEESLLTPNIAVNPYNWILGHIIWRRIVCLEVLDQVTWWSEKTSTVYRTGAEPISSESARPMDLLRSDLEQTEEVFHRVLAQVTDEYLDQNVLTDRGEKSRADQLAGFHWHETFHLGQLDMMRSYILSRRG